MAGKYIDCYKKIAAGVRLEGKIRTNVFVEQVGAMDAPQIGFTSPGVERPIRGGNANDAARVVNDELHAIVWGDRKTSASGRLRRRSAEDR